MPPSCCLTGIGRSNCGARATGGYLMVHFADDKALTCFYTDNRDSFVHNLRHFMGEVA